MLHNVLPDAIHDLSNYLENPLFKDCYKGETKKMMKEQLSGLKKLQKQLLKEAGIEEPAKQQSED